MKLDNKPHGALVHSQISQLVIAPGTQKLCVCTQTASAALLPKAKQDSRGFRTSLGQSKTPGERKAPCCSWLDKKSTLGTHWSPQTCWATPDPAEEGQLMRKVRDPSVLHSTNWPTRKLGPNMLCLHTQNKKSVFVTQLSLSTTKWAKAFKHSSKKKDLWKCNQRNDTENSKFKTKQNTQTQLKQRATTMLAKGRVHEEGDLSQSSSFLYVQE